ncbi:hypothetical protein POSPLADRAFT_1156842, partial [Postia placenta MAD-698-R-SB12]
HLFRLGKVNSVRCSCSTDDETVIHFLLQCPNWNRAHAPLRRAFPPSNLQLLSRVDTAPSCFLIFSFSRARTRDLCTTCLIWTHCYLLYD